MRLLLLVATLVLTGCPDSNPYKVTEGTICEARREDASRLEQAMTLCEAAPNCKTTTAAYEQLIAARQTVAWCASRGH